MRSRYKESLASLLGDERIRVSEKVRFEIKMGSGLKSAQLIATRRHIVLCRTIPMGFQVTLVWYKDVERVATGMKKGRPYAQLLGDASRVLILFKSKETRDEFQRLCLKHIAA